MGKRINMNNQQKVIDFLKEYHPSTPQAYKIATSLLSGLEKESLEVLASVAEDSFIRYRIRTILKARSGTPQNTPFNKLLLHYTDKRSGRVISARDELFRRFPYLDPVQQKRVAKAFFDGSNTDVRMMSSYLMDHWDDMFLDIVVRAWIIDITNEYTAKLVIRYARLDDVMGFMSELEAFDGPMLATRRCQAGVLPEIDDWPLTDYLAILYNSGLSVGEDDAAVLMPSYIVCAALQDLESGRVPDYTRKSDIEHPSLIFLEGVRLMVYYLGCMGLTQALSDLEAMDSELCTELQNGQMPEILADEGLSENDKICAVWRLFCSTIVAHYNKPELKPVKVKLNSDSTSCIE